MNKFCFALDHLFSAFLFKPLRLLFLGNVLKVATINDCAYVAETLIKY